MISCGTGTTVSVKDGRLSINTLDGRIKAPVDWTHVPEEYRHGKFGTARLLNRNGKWLLLVPSTVELPEPAQPQQVVGVDMGVRFLATTYDSDGRTIFYDGKEVKQKREHYKKLRASLQKKGTRSARRRLRKIGRRENRWMRDVNHQVSKALVNRQSKPTLFALENLSGVRRATEKVRAQDRYVQVSWAFYQLRQMIEYKAARAGHSVVAVVDCWFLFLSVASRLFLCTLVACSSPRAWTVHLARAFHIF